MCAAALPPRGGTLVVRGQAFAFALALRCSACCAACGQPAGRSRIVVARPASGRWLVTKRTKQKRTKKQTLSPALASPKKALGTPASGRLNEG
jgi:hypothetical protein